MVCIGKLKDFKAMQSDFIKRIGRFASVNVTELKDEPLNNVKSLKEEETVKKTEGERLLTKCAGYVIACDKEGKSYSSKDFSLEIETLMQNNSTITFLIGGSLGLSDEVLKKANMLLSFSTFTFTHSLFRIILLEQLLRCYKIINNESYHK